MCSCASLSPSMHRFHTPNPPASILCGNPTYIAAVDNLLLGNMKLCFKMDNVSTFLYGLLGGNPWYKNLVFIVGISKRLPLCATTISASSNNACNDLHTSKSLPSFTSAS